MLSCGGHVVFCTSYGVMGMVISCYQCLGVPAEAAAMYYVLIRIMWVRTVAVRGVSTYGREGCCHATLMWGSEEAER